MNISRLLQLFLAKNGLGEDRRGLIEAARALWENFSKGTTESFLYDCLFQLEACDLFHLGEFLKRDQQFTRWLSQAGAALFQAAKLETPVRNISSGGVLCLAFFSLE